VTPDEHSKELEAHNAVITAFEGNLLSYAKQLRRFGKDPRFASPLAQQRDLLLQSVRNIRETETYLPHERILNDRRAREALLLHIEQALREGSVYNISSFSLTKGCGLKIRPTHSLGKPSQHPHVK